MYDKTKQLYDLKLYELRFEKVSTVFLNILSSSSARGRNVALELVIRNIYCSQTTVPNKVSSTQLMKASKIVRNIIRAFNGIAATWTVRN